ncbi:hypothetical protein INT48_007200 [Thamnidium elegans]|uniref:Late embryogenesis abundant protein LEA-2 subgroup domain-containing protein n=1 Tax=Thamnidium elegans TaxID=101142 RepID=A0A8H7SSH6_9FUNG|nr:hypothetical protein INT48_007200 [Thamnidium elegans]
MYQQQQHHDYEPSSYRQHDAYAMNDMTHSRPYYEETKAVPATTDGYYNYATPTTRNSQVAAASSEKFARRNNKENRSCCDKICCGCCTCCPRWCRWCSCIILLIIVGLGITVGVLAAIFKVPTIEFTGIQGTPAFGMQGLTTVNLNISLGFTVDNPNIESVTFTTLAATANYHGDTTQLGEGILHNLHIASYSVTNISFPFNMLVDMTNNNNIAVMSKMMADCGLGGATKKDIKLDYKIVATVHIIGIPISVPVSNSISFPCPIDPGDQSSLLANIESIISGLTGEDNNIGDLVSNVAGGNGLPTNLIPSDILNNIPTDLTNLIG